MCHYFIVFILVSKNKNIALSQERFELLRDMRLGGGKDNVQSTQRREAGNQFFLAGDLQSAMVNYTRAVVLGVENTTELASAFANRSNT